MPMLALGALLAASTASAAFAQPAAPRVVIDPAGAGPHPTFEHTANGVGQVNIATPNGAGVSHNRFVEYGVPENGLILNNSAAAVQTKLGGQIAGNRNLSGGAAGLILNEVTGKQATVMLGQTEVAGQRTPVVVANPNGISCSGCGFVNTSRVTLTTGKPELDANGALKTLTVDDGEVSFEGKGGDFSSVSVLDILSRSVKIKDSAQLHGQTIQVIAGRNVVDYPMKGVKSLKNKNAGKPEFAVDTSAMGGMYANNITMIVNEKGAGVRANGKMAANAGDLDLTIVNGSLVSTGEMSASKDVRISVAGSVNNSGTIVADNNASLNVAGSVTNSGNVKAENALAVNVAGSVRNNGVLSSNSDTTKLNVAGSTVNSGKILARKNASVNASGSFVNSGDLATSSGKSVVKVAGSFKNSGTIAGSDGVDAFVAGSLANNGTISASNGKVFAQASGSMKNSGTIASTHGDTVLQARGSLKNSNTITATDGSLTINGGHIDNDKATMTADNGFTVLGSRFSNIGGRLSTRSGKAYISAYGQVNNINGTIVNRTGDLQIRGGRVVNTNGAIQAGGNVSGLISGYTANRNSSFTAGNAFNVNSYGRITRSGKLGGYTPITVADVK